MSSPPGHYDQNLLADAPAATKAQLQEGYTTDLLNPNHGKATPPLLASQADPERGLVNKEYNGHASPRPLPFWRTKKGLIIIAIAAVVIIAVVVGGAVGGSKHKKTNLNTGPQTPDSSNGGTNGQQEGTPTNTSSHVPDPSPSPPPSPATQGSGPAQTGIGSGNNGNSTSGIIGLGSILSGMAD